MRRNVEIKARITNWDDTSTRAAQIADSAPELLVQHDTFYESCHGRLKLRAFPEGHGELIYYERPDASGPKTSKYAISSTQDAAALDRVLRGAHGVRGEVRKRRTLLLAGRTRIHLDRVEGLGEFLELEVVLEPDESADDGIAEAQALMRSLGVEERDLVEGAYIDLLSRRP